MFAVIKAGGKQYRVVEDQLLKVEGVEGEPGTIVQIGEVIMLGGDKPEIGSPTIAGASVAAEIVKHGRGPKVIAFKKRRRKNSRRKRGHRQDFVLIRISEILTGGAKPSKGPKPKPVPRLGTLLSVVLLRHLSPHHWTIRLRVGQNRTQLQRLTQKKAILQLKSIE